MGEISNHVSDIPREELQIALDSLLEQDIARKRREELSETSFKEWVYNILHTMFARLGYKIVSFEQFWVDVSLSIKSGWTEGTELARKEAELRRRIRGRNRK